MTPVEAIQQLASVLARTTPPFAEDDVYSALEADGLPAKYADRAYKFAQLACGRKFLDGVGVTFSNDYLCFNAHGSVVESGKLNEEEYFIAAMQHVTPEKVGSRSFAHFAMLSADVHAVNEALNAGSNPKDLVTAPAFLFLEPPTDSGLANAQNVITRHLAKLQSPNLPRKPWWKFW